MTKSRSTFRVIGCVRSKKDSLLVLPRAHRSLGFPPIFHIYRHIIEQQSTTTMRMMFLRSTLSVLLLLGLAEAGNLTPQVTVGFNSEGVRSGPLGALEPNLKWTFSEAVGDMDVEVGRSVNGSELEHSM